MAATLSATRAAIQARLATISAFVGTHAEVPDQINVPCAVVQPAPGDFIAYDPALGDDVNYAFYITIYAQGTDAVAGQKELDAFLAPSGSSSVRTAVNGTLGGVVASASCGNARNYRHVILAGETQLRYIVCDIPVTVMT